MRTLLNGLLIVYCLPLGACAQEEPDSTVTYSYDIGSLAIDLLDEEAELLGSALADENPPPDIPERAYLVDFANGKYWMLWQPLIYRIKDSGLSITVPAGFVTDLVSTPRAVWTVVPPTGRYQRAAIIHDWLYWTQPCSRDQSDRIMVLAMEELGVSAVTRGLVYESLERFGEAAWEANREARLGGLPRIVPERLQNEVPDDVAWPAYRLVLAGQGVTPREDYDQVPAFCGLGE